MGTQSDAKRKLAEWVVKTDLRTGMECPDAVEPSDLLIDAHRSSLKRFGYKWSLDFREKSGLSKAEKHERIEALQKQARAQLTALGPFPKFKILLTGATGFLGKEFLLQASQDPRIEIVYCLIRPKKLESPQQRGEELLKALGFDSVQAVKFKFIAGDVEQDGLGVSEEDYRSIEASITHVVHAAANVSFDETFEAAYEANVEGARHAMKFSLKLQNAPRNQFVTHVAIETAYVHGRTYGRIGKENDPVFPNDFFNNNYELTKAIASIDGINTMLRDGLRLIQLRPSIVIGRSGTGNNFGDTKVINAPLKLFAWIAMQKPGLSRALLLMPLLANFPAHRTGTLNLIGVDRVVRSIIASLSVPKAVGIPVQLTADEPVDIAMALKVIHQEMGVRVLRVNSFIFRGFIHPLFETVAKALARMQLGKLLSRVNGLRWILSNYCEKGQINFLSKNVQNILGLAAEVTSPEKIMRMICRHNLYVHPIGRSNTLNEIVRREKVWEEAIAGIETATGKEAVELSSTEFKAELYKQVDMDMFQIRIAAPAIVEKQSSELKSIRPIAA